MKRQSTPPTRFLQGISLMLFALSFSLIAKADATPPAKKATAENPAKIAAENPAVELTDKEKGERVFSLHVYKILKEKCFACHGEDPEKIKGDFDCTSLEGFLAGGETSDTVLVPGNASQSLLMTAIEWTDPDYEMPPKENDRLTESQITKIKNWINWGAPWADESIRNGYLEIERKRPRTAEGILVKTSGGMSDDWTFRRYKEDAVWAFQKVKRPDVPHPNQANPKAGTKAPAKELHPIDAFIRQKLAKASLKPAPMADPRNLLRRAHHDLIGLPPTPSEHYQFQQAWKADPKTAWNAVIEKLLASPHYGERWGQHWLDIARYADTAGFSNDFERSNAWRYRDYVIRSFNSDKPYHQFVKEQLAGDELDPGNPEMTIATGFLRMGPWGTAMVPQPVKRQMWLDDVVNNVGQTFLGTPMRCCKCHDHKFDPIPTQDYYRMYAAFAATQPAELEAPFLPTENRVGFGDDKALVQELWNLAEKDRKRLIDIQETAAKAWYKENGREYKNENARKADPDDEKPPRLAGLDSTEKGTLKVRQQDVKIWKRRHERTLPLAQAVYSGPDYNYNGISLRKKEAIKGWSNTNHIYLGGSFEAKGPAVTPGVLSFVDGAVVNPVSTVDPYADAFALPTEIEGRRLGLAKWIANDNNGLANRTMVNRIWQYHFGKGIAGNPNNLGGKGKLPTHPELLEWLTAKFTANGGSVKSMHRLIMSSETYMQSTQHPDLDTLSNKDPNNDLLARFLPRRLTAEELRDSLLSISGELNRDIGGLPIRPEINMEVLLQPRMIQFSLAPVNVPSETPAERNRRTIYAYRVRGQADPFLEIFNLPNPNESCEMRDAAAVTPQVFTMLNSDVMSDRAVAFALRLEALAKDDVTKQIQNAFNECFGRGAQENELKQLKKYHADMVAYHKEHAPEKPSYPTELTRSLVEEFSGDTFEYTEWLPGFEEYVPDRKPSDVGPETRALADIALLLFNSNEFVYLY